MLSELAPMGPVRPAALNEVLLVIEPLLLQVVVAPASAHRPDQVVDRAGRDAVDIGFLDHRRQRPLGHPERLKEARKVVSPSAVSGYAAPPSRPASPSPGRDSHCAEPAGRANARHAPRRSSPRPPSPSAARRRRRSSRAESASRAFSTSLRRSIISSVIGGSSVAFEIRNPKIPKNRR